MSDRYVFDATKEQVEQQFGVSTKRNDFYESHFNITPGSLIPVIYFEDGKREIYRFRWGQIPPGADEERDGIENYEISTDQVLESNWQLKCLKSQRCLIPAHGFYKWKTTEKQSTPFYIRLLSNELMAIAGIYSVWESDSGRNVYSCSMLTSDANALIQPVGDRMPVILEPENYNLWLAQEPLGQDILNSLVSPFPMSKMAVNRVSEDVNDRSNNSPELIQPIPK
ncbi:SOS response-associated peptidase [Fodinibius salsisoli]|uniref:Abasic site processing protein n=1 Tax=Fodinibius salsisoli TaxID=2820877 RepID=A0ABT3PRM4_9BACT|nr:SOS response-associated peptidase [Fodinibius salsisoli]MCW9708480.1 SOS response-associated peptidase [Fodinibius salsisoli]